ncbi:flagellar hook-length control protein FliK [Hungatella hathewayi]
MNMETAMKASVTGWKQQVTANHGKGRAAGKANFADTFSEMLKAGKKAAEDRNQSQSARKTPEIQTGSKTDDTGNDTVRAEASGPADTRAEKAPEKKPDTKKTEDSAQEEAGKTADLEIMAEQAAVMAEAPAVPLINGANAEEDGLQAVTEAGSVSDQTEAAAVPGSGTGAGYEAVQAAAAENAGASDSVNTREMRFQPAAQKVEETENGQKTEAVKSAEAEHTALAGHLPVTDGNGTGREEGSFSDLLKGHSEQMKAMGTGTQVQTEEETVSDDAMDNRMLEELKKNSDGKGMSFQDRLSVSQQGALKGVPSVDNTASDLHTPVAEQLKAGVEQGMKRELSEFTIKLKPEGLGEIVVHMASAGGRTSVSIGVANPETEKLINSQMMSLKEMLEPLHAEVEEVYHNSQGGMDFAGFGQELYQNQGQQARGHYRRGVNQGLMADDGVFIQETERMAAESLVRRLYAYV